MWIITKFSGSTPVRHPFCSKPLRKFVQTSYALKSQFIGLIFVADSEGHVHSVTHGQLRKPQHTYVKRAVRKAHFKLNWAFKVIQGHFYWCRQKSRTVYRRHMQLMPMLFLKLTEIIMATGKRQIRRFQRPHSGLKTSQQETPSNIYKRFILPETRFIDLHFCRRYCGSIFSNFHAIMFESRTLWI